MCEPCIILNNLLDLILTAVPVVLLLSEPLNYVDSVFFPAGLHKHTSLLSWAASVVKSLLLYWQWPHWRGRSVVQFKDHEHCSCHNLSAQWHFSMSPAQLKGAPETRVNVILDIIYRQPTDSHMLGSE